MINKLISYIKNSKLELKKVVWPSKQQIINHTFLVIGISIAMAIFLGIIDFGLTRIIEVVI